MRTTAAAMAMTKLVPEAKAMVMTILESAGYLLMPQLLASSEAWQQLSRQQLAFHYLQIQNIDRLQATSNLLTVTLALHSRLLLQISLVMDKQCLALPLTKLKKEYLLQKAVVELHNFCCLS